MVTKYQKRISGSLLDRIDLHIEVPRVDYEKLSGDRLTTFIAHKNLPSLPQPRLPCADNGLRAICDLQFGENARDVVLHGLDT